MTADRVKSILTSEGGRAMPALAEFVAFETEIAADQALQILAAAQTDIAAAGKGGFPGASANTSAGDGQIRTPTHGGSSGGLGAPETTGGVTSADKAKAAWGQAVAQANSRFQ